MKVEKTYVIIGSIVALGIGYWFYKRYRSRKAIEQVKNDELSKTPAPGQAGSGTQANPVPEIPKIYIRSGTSIPPGAISFAGFEKNSF